MTMIAATTKSTAMQNGGHQRVLATKWVRCCQRSLSPWPTKPGDQQPRRPGDRRGGDDDERERHAALDRDHLRPSVGDGEADVDRRRSATSPEGVDGGGCPATRTAAASRPGARPKATPHSFAAAGELCAAVRARRLRAHRCFSQRFQATAARPAKPQEADTNEPADAGLVDRVVFELGPEGEHTERVGVDPGADRERHRDLARRGRERSCGAAAVRPPSMIRSRCHCRSRAPLTDAESSESSRSADGDAPSASR